ncbi:hypothetical protein Gogos_015084 [Gossypium gossypioides]|uniref:laccase n=1 Tax=Gossypium gossypioides TaxID=34282 RepID=A0A7J9C0P4_GOSGO|nr:hypothetical protein [Gossypium gossypioides]
MIGTPQLSAVNENKEHLAKTIDECYNNFENDQIQIGIDLLSQARYPLHDEVYKLWTDGRRILVFPNGNIQEDRDEESLKLLKKIADIELEEFSSHIIEKIKYTWETWNSPPRLSLDSLHLDEIEEMNLNNMQEVKTYNGLLGPLHNCSRDGIYGLLHALNKQVYLNFHCYVYTINVTKGKNYLLRIINAALNMEHFFMVANHTMTVVETDGEYTKPFKTTFLMLTPGQTYNVLIKADQSIGKYFMAMAPYMPAKNVPFLKKTSYGILRYASPTVKVDKLARKSHVKTSMTPLEPIIPNVNDTASVQAFSDQVKRLYPNHQWSPVDVPLRIDKTLFFTIGFNVVDTQPAIGTQVSILEHGWAVQVIFQDTGTVGTEKHPIHLHGFSFYLLGTGLGNYNSSTALLNLYDPPYRNTVGVPVGRWAVIRFRADNPGMWFMHCHLEVHTTWGLSMAFLVKNGKGKMQNLPPPPPDLPLC